MSPRIAIVIPARYESTRFPGKALAPFRGQPMVVQVLRRAAATPGVARVIVATDDGRILEAVRAAGGEAVMTSPEHRSGTDRVAEVARGLEVEIVVNVQGDEPLIDPAAIAAAVEPLVEDPELSMATLVNPLGPQDAGDLGDPNVVKAVLAHNGDALYFSRAAIPHPRFADQAPAYRHVGLYVYRRDFLLRLAELPQTPLERAEGLEQLRVLEHGHAIRCVPTDYRSWGVDTPEQLAELERRAEELT